MPRAPRPLLLALAALLLLAGCSTGTKSAGTRHAPTATVAEAANTPAYYLFPLTPLTNYSGVNDPQFQDLIYRPLYWVSDGSKVVENGRLSLAAPPVYSDGGRTATVALKPYSWSDGKPVVARDVVFWMNLLRAAKDNWAGYVPGEFPDNVRSVTATDARTVVFTFDRVYNPQWLLYNELSQITPLPQHAWDRTSASGPVGDLDRTPAGAKAVYTFLLGQGNAQATYATNPLWQVVDGPWKVGRFANGNDVDLVPNPAYSGPVKPTLTLVHLKPFTSDTAEFNVLRSGGDIDVGYLPPQQGRQSALVTRKGYAVTKATSWSVNYTVPNLNNPKVGPALRQLAVRQALETLIDQDGWVKGAYLGNGAPTYGPVPLVPDNPFVSELTRKPLFPFDVAKAAAILTAHGWSVVKGGTTTCRSPGAGPAQCGPGVAAGTALAFTLEYPNGLAALDRALQVEKSTFAQAGVQLTLVPEPLDTVNAHEQACTPAEKKCSWQLVQGDLAWTYQPDYYPEGSALFATGAGSNAGGYSDRTADSLISATHTSTSPDALRAYQDYVAAALPVLWTPKAQTLVAVRTGLSGTSPDDPFGNLYPENWRWK